MTRSALSRRRVNRRQEVLKTTVIREFDGGLNIIDNDLNLSSRFAKELNNMYRGPDGSILTRYGTRLFASLSTVLGADIVNHEYFRAHIIAVGKNGKIAKVDGTGVATLIWDEDIANALVDSPNGWGTTSFVSFAQFKGELLIANGLDKPLIVASDITVNYLQDLSSLSNAFVPVARYVVSHNQYVIHCGDLANPSILHISQTGASGTYLGEPSTDAVQFDLGAYIPKGDTKVVGAGAYRDKLVVVFSNAIVIMTLGVFNSSNEHVPTVDDVIDNFGGISHRSIQALGDDMLMADIVGVPSIERALFTGSIKPQRASELVDPAIQEELNDLSLARMEDDVHSVYNKVEGQYMLFVPDDPVDASTIDTKVFVYTLIRGLKIKAWSTMSRWKWTAASRSEEGRVFFSRGSNLFVYGNKNDPINADFVGDEETFSDETIFTDDTGLNPVADESDSGIPIPFVWELPWADFDTRMKTKVSRYLMMDTKGTAQFTVQMFVDNLFEDRTDLGEEFTDNTLFTDNTGFTRRSPKLDPTLEMQFRGGDALGFGSGFGGFMGGGRITSDERLVAWTAHFRIAKIRIFGESREPLQIISLGLGYANGSIRR